MEFANTELIEIKYKLPFAFIRGDNSLMVALIYTHNELIKALYEFWVSLAQDINPMTVDESLLDFFALSTGNPWRILWDVNWSVDAKRKLLRDTELIFSQRLFISTLQVLFDDFGLLSRVRPKTGWILGTTIPPATALPATIGTSILDYEVVVPTSYYMGSIEWNLTTFIVQNFGLPGNIAIVIE